MREKINAFLKMLVCLSAALYPFFVSFKDRIFFRCSLQSRLNQFFSFPLFYLTLSVAMETGLTATATVAVAVAVAVAEAVSVLVSCGLASAASAYDFCICRVRTGHPGRPAGWLAGWPAAWGPLKKFKKLRGIL